VGPVPHAPTTRPSMRCRYFRRQLTGRRTKAPREHTRRAATTAALMLRLERRGMRSR
jgi:hypothetical protein